MICLLFKLFMALNGMKIELALCTHIYYSYKDIHILFACLLKNVNIFLTIEPNCQLKPKPYKL